MLELAIKHQTKLNEKFLNLCSSGSNYLKYYIIDDWCDYNIKISDSSWDKLQYVSVDKEGNVLGYIKADVGRPTRILNNFALVNLTGKANLTFSKDILNFIDLCFKERKFIKMEFNVIVGNPAEKIYDKFIKKCGGSVVGTLHKSSMLHDGKYYDKKLYEILREE